MNQTRPCSAALLPAATAGFLAHCFSSIPNAIWWGYCRRSIVADFLDDILYGAITGVIVAWLWPH